MQFKHSINVFAGSDVKYTDNTTPKHQKVARRSTVKRASVATQSTVIPNIR